MKDNRSDKSKKRGVTLTANFSLYIVIFFAALIFTQALRSKASNIFFGFIFLLPWVMLIYALTARATLKINMLSETATIAKKEPYSYKIRLINESILPYPFVDAVIELPQLNSVRCAPRTVKMAMSPRADYTVNNTVAFRFRGTYEIGVECIYVYDFFRMFRVRVDINTKETVYVLPRRLNLDIGEANAVSDSAKKTQKSPNSYEKIEISDIREYRSGDPLKSIHWKLSSKSEDFVVRDYDTGTSKETIVFCDMSARFPDVPPEREIPEAAGKKAKGGKSKKNSKVNAVKPSAAVTGADGVTSYDSGEPDIREVADADADLRSRNRAEASERGKKRRRAARAAKENKLEIDTVSAGKRAEVDVGELAQDSYYDDMNEYCADGIVELTVAAVLRELRGGSECTLLWFDERSESGVYVFTLRGIDDFNAVFRLFATAPLAPRSDSVSRLSAMIKDTQDVKQLIVTSAIDPESVRELCSMPSVADGASTGAAEVILYNPEERFAHKNERKLYIEGCRGQLSSKGLRLAEGRTDQGV